MAKVTVRELICLNEGASRRNENDARQNQGGLL
jgi:hypothetical protein